MLYTESLYFLSGKFIIGVLIFIRITGMMASAPFLKSEAIPTSVKIMLSVILSIVVTSAFWQEQGEIDLDLWFITFVALKEFLVGLIFGFAANTIFYAARMAGSLIDTEMGFQTSLLFDSSSGAPTLLGEIYELLVLMVFLILNGHHYLIEGIFISLKMIPLMQFEMTTSTVDLLMQGATTVLILSVKMASPLLVALFLTNLSLALLGRIAPQTNIFTLSFQVKVFVGLVMLFLTVPLMVYVAKISMSSFQEDILKILMTMNPKRVY